VCLSLRIGEQATGLKNCATKHILQLATNKFGMHLLSRKSEVPLKECNRVAGRFSQLGIGPYGGPPALLNLFNRDSIRGLQAARFLMGLWGKANGALRFFGGSVNAGLQAL